MLDAYNRETLAIAIDLSASRKQVAPNILGQQFSPPAANIVWATAIAHIRTNEGWLYLATVIDLYSRRIIGWSMGTRLLTKLVADSLPMALQQRKPPRGVIHHSARCSQYCRDAYQALLSKYGFICSMSGRKAQTPKETVMSAQPALGVQCCNGEFLSYVES